MKIALAAWNMEKPITSHKEWMGRLSRLSLECQDCDVLVLPEYWGMQILDLSPEDLKQTDEVSWMAGKLAHFDLLGSVQEIADKYDIAILPGSWPVETPNGYVNRAHFINTDGVLAVQDKMSLTDEETDRLGWYLKPGSQLDTFEFLGTKCAIAICHDTSNKKEFKEMHDDGVSLVFMPSMCEFEGNEKTVDGHKWIFEHAMLRSGEMECYFACVGSVGMQSLGDERFEKNIGGAALYKDGISIAEIPPISKGRGNTAYVLKVDIDV